MNKTADIDNRSKPLRLSPEAKGQAGQEDARRHLPQVALDAIRDAIENLRGKGPFTTDRIRGELSFAVLEIVNHPHHHNALQGVLTRLARSGIIRATGDFVRSQRPTRRGGMLRVWVYPTGELKSDAPT